MQQAQTLESRAQEIGDKALEQHPEAYCDMGMLKINFEAGRQGDSVREYNLAEASDFPQVQLPLVKSSKRAQQLSSRELNPCVPVAQVKTLIRDEKAYGFAVCYEDSISVFAAGFDDSTNNHYVTRI